MRRWLRLGQLWSAVRQILSIRSLLEWVGWWKPLVAAMTAIALAMWGHIEGLQQSQLIVIALGAFAAVLFILTSSVVLWRAMSTMRDEETAKLKAQQVLQSLIEKRQWAVDHLQHVPVQSYLELRRWEETHAVWWKEVIALLQEVCSPGEVADFAKRGLYSAETHQQAYVGHNANLNQLTKDLEGLLKIIDSLEESLPFYRS
jgi:hypothetical protein